MKLLAIDTATEACSVALSIDGDCRERFEVAGREHSQKLPAMFASLLAEAGIAASQLDGLVAGIGPGSFAGVRIGVSFVKGLGLGLDRPAVGISSLAMLAQAAIARGAQWSLPAIDARMSQVYIGIYQSVGGLAQLRGEEAVLAPEQWCPSVTEAESGAAAAVGSGWQAWGDVLLGRLMQAPSWIDGAALPHARDALLLAQAEFAAGRAGSAAQLLPNYLRNRVALTQTEQIAARLAAKQKPS
jgi:tRNA threonylcarbamoyladenosine biosynthesis protein TsaB